MTEQHDQLIGPIALTNFVELSRCQHKIIEGFQPLPLEFTLGELHEASTDRNDFRAFCVSVQRFIVLHGLQQLAPVELSATIHRFAAEAVDSLGGLSVQGQEMLEQLRTVLVARRSGKIASDKQLSEFTLAF